MTGGEQVFLFVVWAKARPYEDEIRATLARDFKILLEAEMAWPRRDFTRKLREFYGFGSCFTWWNKARKCGRGPFKVFLVEDPHPEFRSAIDTRGRLLLVDAHVYRDKQTLRLKTHHSNLVHSSVTAEETDAQMKVLFGCGTGEFLSLLSCDLKFLAAGSRRACYEIPGKDLCLKCYRDEPEAPNATVAREIRRFRHDERRNTCCQEYRYYRELKRRLPDYVFAAFPERLDRVYLPSRGWCLVESRIRNADGSPCERFSRAYRAADKATRAKLVKEFWLLVGAFAAYGVRFYDPQNVVVQRLADGTFRLRVVDFEPASRTLFPVDSFCSAIRRRKVIRRVVRYLAIHCGCPKSRYHGIPAPLRRKWDDLIAIEGAKLGLADCRAFLENKAVNDIFYEGVFNGRPCIVKCSSKAPDSIANEYEMSRRMFAAEPLSCAEPLALWRSPDGKSAFVVTERLSGPSLTELRKDPERLKPFVDGIADDFLRVSDALAKVGIVHRDMGTTDNYLLGADGHFKLIDFQFAIDRELGPVDPWLHKNVKAHYVSFGTHLRNGFAVWNDVAYLVSHLRLRIPATSHSQEVADMLEVRIAAAEFAKRLSWREKAVLRLYRISLFVQLLAVRGGSARENLLRRRFERCRFNGTEPSHSDTPMFGPAEMKARIEALRGQEILVSPPGETIPCYETFDHEKLCKKPLVSVVMTVYNHEQFLERAVKGVVEQRTSFEYELLLCEDCSEDRTREMCFEYQKRHPDKVKVLWYDENVRKYGGNGNRGMSRCRGEFLAFCEGDDCWVNPDKLEKQIALMRKYPTCGLCFAGTDYFSEDDQRVVVRFDPSWVPHEFEPGAKIVKRAIMGSAVSYGLYGPARHTSTMLCRKSACEKAIRTCPEVLKWRWRFGDTCLLAALASVSDVCFLRELASVYRLNAMGVTRRVPALLMRDVHAFNVLAATRLLHFPYRESVAFFADKLVWAWFRCMRQFSNEDRARACAAIRRTPDLLEMFSRLHCRMLLSVVETGKFRGWRYACARSIFILISDFRKKILRRRCEFNVD